MTSNPSLWVSETVHTPLTCCFAASLRQALLARLAKGPIMLGPKVVTYAGLLGGISDGLDIVTGFDTPVTGAGSTGWTGVAMALQELWELRDTPVPTPPAPPSNIPLPPPSVLRRKFAP